MILSLFVKQHITGKNLKIIKNDMFFLGKDKKGQTLLLFLSIIIVVIISYLSKKFIMVHFNEQSLILYQLPMFLIGVFIYHSSFNPISSKQKRISLIIAILLCIYSILIKCHKDNFYLLISAFLLVISCRNTPLSHKLNKFFEIKIFSVLSDLSYSVYLFHGFFLSIIGALIEKSLYPLGWTSNNCICLIIPVVTAASYLTAYFSYKFIEIPGINLGKKLLKKSQNTSAFLTPIFNQTEKVCEEISKS